MKESYENLVELWGNCEEILYLISNKSGELPRDGIRSFARPISGKIEEVLKSGTVNLETEEDLINLVREAQFYRDTQEVDRGFGINFSKKKKKKNTIEFRLSNGTLDADNWIQNINLFGGIMKTCQELAIIQTKEGELSEEEKRMLDIFEKLKYSKYNIEKLELLLLLVIPEENRDLYRDRYISNFKLLKENMQMEAILTARLANNPINIKKYRKKDIAEAVFLGNEPLDGVDYNAGEGYCISDLEEHKVKNKA